MSTSTSHGIDVMAKGQFVRVIRDFLPHRGLNLVIIFVNKFIYPLGHLNDPLMKHFKFTIGMYIYGDTVMYREI